jgi:hypothetical protein
MPYRPFDYLRQWRERAKQLREIAENCESEPAWRPYRS